MGRVSRVRIGRCGAVARVCAEKGWVSGMANGNERVVAEARQGHAVAREGRVWLRMAPGGVVKQC